MAHLRVGLLRSLPLLGHHVWVDESRWVLFDGGPRDGDYYPVPAPGGRLPARVEVPVYLPAGTIPGVGTRLVEVHVYELVEPLVGVRPVYRWVDPQG